MMVGQKDRCHRCAATTRRICDLCVMQGRGVRRICDTHAFVYESEEAGQEGAIALCTSCEAGRAMLFNRLNSVRSL